jgi:hypothetical protein
MKSDEDIEDYKKELYGEVEELGVERLYYIKWYLSWRRKISNLFTKIGWKIK